MSMAWELERSPFVKKIHHATIINWIKQVGELLPNSYSPDRIPQVGELDELETFVGKKKQDLDMDGGRSF